MQAEISKDFEFSASHVIEGLSPDHKCSRLHGHSYRARVELSGETDEVGFIIDFGHLEWIRSFIDQNWDHKHLNDVIDVNPTSENLAALLAQNVEGWLLTRPEASRISRIRVGVSETRATWARHERNFIA